MPEKRQTKVGFAGETKSIEVNVPDGEPAIWDADTRLRVVGTAVPRVDGALKATGRATYTADVALPGMLHARFVRAPGPGTVRSIDLDAAKASPGVVHVRAFRNPGQPVLFDGQDVAIVVADTEDRAEDGVRACALTIDRARAVVDVDSAEAAGAAPVIPGSDTNVRRGGRGGRGPSQADVDAAFAKADEAIAQGDFVIERTYRTQVQTHSALEPHGAVVRPDDDGGVTVWCSSQGTNAVRDGIAGVLKLPAAKVRAIVEHVGGGFGGKLAYSPIGSGLCNEVARAAMELKRPVRGMLDRREEHACGGNRPSSVQTVKLGIRKDGRVTGYAARIKGSAGIQEGGAGAANPMIYDVGVAAKEEVALVTNAGPSIAFRAPGHPQGSFALESALDEAADAIGMDPLELRLALDRSPTRRWEWTEGAKRFGWAAKRRRPVRSGSIVRGVGLGAAQWGGAGAAGSTVLVTAHRDGGVEVSSGAQDIGTGTRTVLAVIVAEVLGLDPQDVHVNLGRSEWPPGQGSGGSMTAPSVGPSARAAAEAARAALLGDAAPSKAAWKSACAKLDGDSKVFSGERGRPYETYRGGVAGCQFAEVAVDVDTGVVSVVGVLAMQDCGRVIDKLTAESQVMGAVIGGISYALFEDRILDPATGRLLHGDLEGYRIAGPRDVPDIDVVMVDVANAGNSVGMLGLGEPPSVPTAAAIANAVAHALSAVAPGARVRELPITPARVIAAIEAAERASKGGK